MGQEIPSQDTAAPNHKPLHLFATLDAAKTFAAIKKFCIFIFIYIELSVYYRFQNVLAKVMI